MDARMREEQGPSRRAEPIVDDEEKGQGDDEGNKTRIIGVARDKPEARRLKAFEDGKEPGRSPSHRDFFFGSRECFHPHSPSTNLNQPQAFILRPLDHHHDSQPLFSPFHTPSTLVELLNLAPSH